MLQHLLNSTAIWLLCLVVFDVLLRRDTYHAYNRIFLLATFLLGILLPLWEWNNADILNTAGMTRPVERAEILRSSITQTAGKPEQTDWLLIIYMSGVAVSMFLLLKESITLRRLYTKGKRSKDGVWTIIETGKEHTPFSAFGLVFISSRQNYSVDELRIILTHEEQHGHLLHFIDLVIMHLGKIVFWFHPLVYLYHNRLMMVHEYQADAAVGKQPSEYGKFLVEQALLLPAPTLSQPFNRSPIKSRIVMLTRKTSALAKGKKLIAAPLLLACLLFFTQRGFSEDARKEGNKIYYKGNVFEMWAPATNDTIMVEDPVTGEWVMKIKQADSIPVKLNGNYIYREGDLSRPEKEQATKTRLAIQEFIVNEMQPAFETLEDGVYIMNVNNVIVDDEGEIVFFNRPFVMNNADPNALTEIQTMELIDRFKAVLNTGKKFEPIIRSGKPATFNIENLYDHLYNLIIIRGHKRQK